MPRIDKAMEKFSAIFLLLIASAVHCESGKHSSRIDDVECDVQLEFFTESLANRELWAMECKKSRLSSWKSISIFCSTFQCLTHGRNFNLASRSAMPLILAISSSVSISDSTRAWVWSKVSTAWCSIKPQRTPQCSLAMEIRSIGLKCEWRSMCLSIQCLIKTFIHHIAEEASWEQDSSDSAPVSAFHHPARHPGFNYLSTTFWRMLTCSWRLITIRQTGVWRANPSRIRPSTLFACILWNPNQVCTILTFVITAQRCSLCSRIAAGTEHDLWAYDDSQQP